MERGKKIRRVSVEETMQPMPETMARKSMDCRNGKDVSGSSGSESEIPEGGLAGINRLLTRGEPGVI